MKTNTVNLIGRLTRDPEVKYLPTNSMAVVNITIAVDRPNSNGEQTADFLPVTVFGKTAKKLAAYMKKGSRIGVEGSLSSRTYEGSDGKKHTAYSVVARRIEFLEV